MFKYCQSEAVQYLNLKLEIAPIHYHVRSELLVITFQASQKQRLLVQLQEPKLTAVTLDPFLSQYYFSNG